MTAPMVCGPRTMAHLDDALRVLDARLSDEDRVCSMHWSTRGMLWLTSTTATRG